MVLPKCYGCIKYSLVWLNVVFWAVGLAAVALVLWMINDETFLVSIAQEQQSFNAGLLILLVSGIVMLVVSFLGCCGACRESQCMLIGFFGGLLVVMVAQIAAGVWLYTNSDRLEELVKPTVISTVKNEYGVIESRTQTVDAFQSGLGCCGATGPADWAGSAYSNYDRSSTLSLTVSSYANNAYKVPKSCCKVQKSDTCDAARNLKIADIVSPVIYNEGCVDKLVEALKSQSCTVIIVVTVIGVLELLGLIFTLVLCCTSESSERYKA